MPASTSPTGANCLSSLTSRLSREVSSARVGDQEQPVGLERLLDEVVGAALDRRDRGFDIAVAGDHHHRQFGMLALDAARAAAARRACCPAARCRERPDSGGASAIAASASSLSRAVRVP